MYNRKSYLQHNIRAKSYASNFRKYQTLKNGRLVDILSQDIRVGDRLLPTFERKVDSVFYPKSPKVDIEGKIIHVFSGVRNVSQYNVVVLNRGERDTLAVGDVLAIYRRGEQVRDRFTSELLQLPDERAGLLIVFRTFEKFSF